MSDMIPQSLSEHVRFARNCRRHARRDLQKLAHDLLLLIDRDIDPQPETRRRYRTLVRTLSAAIGTMSCQGEHLSRVAKLLGGETREREASHGA